MKRFLAILLVLVLTAFVFAACKKDGEDGEPNDPPVSESSSGGGESQSESGSESQSESTEVDYISTNIFYANPEKGSADMPEVPFLPDGQLPTAE